VERAPSVTLGLTGLWLSLAAAACGSAGADAGALSPEVATEGPDAVLADASDGPAGADGAAVGALDTGLGPEGVAGDAGGAEDATGVPEAGQAADAEPADEAEAALDVPESEVVDAGAAPWTFGCGDSGAAGAFVLDFSAGAAGKKCCMLSNVLSGQALAIPPDGLKVVAYAPSQQAAAELAYQAGLEDPASGAALSLPHMVSAGASALVCVMHAPPPLGSPNARALLRVGAAGAGAEVGVALLGAPCKPSLVLAPALGDSFAAAPGGSETRKILVGNPGCGPLTLLEACVLEQGAGGPSSCQVGTPSGLFGIAGGFVSTVIKSFEVHDLSVTFAPTASGNTTVSHAVNLVYCEGTWDGTACSSGDKAVATLVLNGCAKPWGSAQVPPALALSVGSAGPLPKAGGWVSIAASASGGSYEVQGWVFALLTKPAGAAAWLGAEDQAEPWAAFVPDLPGEWKVLATAQAYDEPGASLTCRPSPQAIVTIDVK